MKYPGLLLGGLLGAALMLPVTAISFLGTQAAGFTFLPFALFDWTARALPGSVVTAGIDTMVAAINGLNPNATSDTYKLIEQIMALAFPVGMGLIAGALFFFLLPRLLRGTFPRLPLLPGVIVGAITAAVVLAIVGAVPPVRTADPVTDAIWLAGLVVLWGVLLGYCWGRLTVPVPTSAADRLDTVTAQTIDRRRFLVQVGGATAAITVVGAGVGALLPRRDPAATAVADAGLLPEAIATAESTPAPEALPNADDPVVPVPGTRPEVTPLDDHYRIDINLIPPTIPEQSWALRFTSALDGPGKRTLRTYTLDEIRAFPVVQAYVTMACISNPVAGHLISTIQWTGLTFQGMLDEVGIPDGATHVKIYAADGFDEVVSLELVREDPRVMLCYAWEDQPLTVEHGFPLRIHIPNLYGMKQPKWITEIEFLSAWEPGYWVRRGWSEEAIVFSTSVIDTVAVDEAYEQDGQRMIPLGGIAWAGDRRIGQVQVRVDDGEWQDARVRAPISDRTWVIWRFEWPFSAGQHRFEVRCIEADGTPQLETRRDVRPDGATGLHGTTERF